MSFKKLSRLNSLASMGLIGLLFFSGCASVPPLVKHTVSPLENPVNLKANRDFLPSYLKQNPEYTIRKGEEWSCLDRLDNSNVACCPKKNKIVGSVNWKYCLAVDSALNAYAWFDPDLAASRNFTEGPAAIFDNDQAAIKSKIESWRAAGWPENIIEAARFQRVVVGMTPEQAIEAWGLPNGNNRTTTAGGTTEQWVYEAKCYIYFENGILKAIQD